MLEKFTEKAINIISTAQKEAQNLNECKIYPQHILLGILQSKSNICSRLLSFSGLNINDLRSRMQRVKYHVKPDNVNSVLSFSEEAKQVITDAFVCANEYKNSYIIPEHLMLALIKNDSTESSKILKLYGVDVEKLRSTLIKLLEKKRRKMNHHPENRISEQETDGYSNILSLFKEQDLQDVLSRAVAKLTASNYEILGTEQIVQSILEDTDSQLSHLLNEYGINIDTYTQKLKEINSRQAEFEEKQIIFTPNAFKTMILALETAKELGSATVKPEHIILGLLKNKSGIAYNIFKELKVEDNNLAHKIIKPIEKQMPETLTILRFAKQEARNFGRNVVGSEFLLLGIIDEAVGIGAVVLSKLGINIRDARIEVEKVLGTSSDYVDKDISFSERAKRILEKAWERAKRFNKTKIYSEDLLWAITLEPNSLAMRVLANMGVDVLEIRQGILTEIQRVSLEQHN